MLDWKNPTSVLQEINGAEAFREPHMQAPRLAREWFCGDQYRSGWGVKQPEASVHAYMAMLLPRIAHDNPRARVTTSMPTVQRMVAPMLQAGLNRWGQMFKMRRTIGRLSTDLALGWGVSCTRHEPYSQGRPWDADGPWLPRTYRIDPERWIQDPLATHFEEARYAGHWTAYDLDDLKRIASVEEGWDEEAVGYLAPTNVINFGDGVPRPSDLNRKQVMIYELWVPEIHQADTEEWDRASGQNTVNGTIFTIGRFTGGDSAWIRKPRPYYGPRQGPYALWGAYDVPNDPYPLSPIVACMAQIGMANTMAVVQETAMKNYRRVLFGEADVMKKVQENKTDTCFAGTAQQITSQEIGGMTPHNVTAAQATFERVDRALGMSDAMRGNVTGDGTATEAAIAQGSANARIAHIQHAAWEGTNQCYESAGWYMFHDPRVKIPVGEIRSLALQDGVFTGGVQAGPWDAIGVEVDVQSMGRMTEALAQKRAQDLMQLSLQTAQAQLALPNLKGKELLQMVGDMNNMPQLADVIDWNFKPQQMPQPQMGGRR